ncbi:MAG: ATP-binding cassette domain-containing protein [Alphaproteobacteria bacterium]|nr:ATP-binding cassette domain-containing protein [Alphaproteobacteria bacterium]
MAPGRAVAFVGPSGCGKSTLIDLLALTLRPDAVAAFTVTDPQDGRVTDIAPLWQKRRLDDLGRLRARHFGYVLQTGGLLPFLSVRQNIELTQRILGYEDRARVDELARRLDIADLLAAPPAKLSVGQRQRVAIARALAHRPALVLADEPTASLDPVNADAVMDLFMELIAGVGAALVLVTHDCNQPKRFGVPMVEAQVGRDGTTVRTVFDPGQDEEPVPEADGPGGAPVGHDRLTEAASAP